MPQQIHLSTLEKVQSYGLSPIIVIDYLENYVEKESDTKPEINVKEYD